MANDHVRSWLGEVMLDQVRLGILKSIYLKLEVNLFMLFGCVLETEQITKGKRGRGRE